jgi:malonyl-CoA O-methyltransferase
VTHLEKRLVRRDFEQASADYDAAAGLQQEAGERLIERLLPVQINPKMVLDVGAGTGAGIEKLRRLYPKARTLALDIAPAMLRVARSKAPRFWSRQGFVCGDAEQLPLAANSVDLLHSNLTFQWCNEPQRVYAEVARVLTPGGLAVFSTFGTDTLKELRASWAAVDQAVHVNQFQDMHDIGDALLAAGLAGVVMDTERLTEHYPDAWALMRRLKQIGAHNVNAGRRPGLTGRGALAAMEKAYETMRGPEGLPASYELVFAHGWKPAQDQSLPVSFSSSPGGPQ